MDYEQELETWHERLYEAGRGDGAMAGHNGTWKHTERAVARVLGGQRMGPGGDRADVRSRWLCVEVKHRKVLPTWLTDALGQAHRYCGPGQLAVSVLHEAGARHADDVVCLRLQDFEQWFGQLPMPEGMDPADVAAGLEAGYTIRELAGVRAEE